MDDRLRYLHPRPPRRTSRRGAGWFAGMIAGSIAIVLMLVIGARAVLVRALCEQSPVRLLVAASLDVAPTMQRLGQYFNGLHRDVSGHCAQVEVTEDRADTVAAGLSGAHTAPGADYPVDAWVPDSSLWVDLVRGSGHGDAVHPTGISVASSPLVIALPRLLGPAVIRSAQQAGWRAMFPPQLGGPAALLRVQAQLPDPAHSAAGLATIVSARRLIGGGPRAGAEFTSFVHNVVPSTSFDDPQSLSYFAALALPPWNLRPVTIASEQSVAAYNQASPRFPLTAVYPRQRYDLDYPFVLTTSSSLKAGVAAQFEQILASGHAATDARAAGFRPADGAGNPADPPAGSQDQPGQGTGPTVTLAAPAEANSAAQAWGRLNLGSRDLVLDDVSAAMGKPLGSAGQTRLRVLQQAASLGLSLFPASTQIALWEYSDKMTGPAPYRVLVPMGPLPAQLGLITRRQQLQQITDTLTPRPGAPAALHSSIWAAFQWMTGHYQAGHVNAVVVFGSGTETARDDMPLHALLTALRAAYNPRRPIEIITVSAGSSGDTNGLRQITAISHGAAYTVAKPADIAHVFFDAVARRICNPDCPVG